MPGNRSSKGKDAQKRVGYTDKFPIPHAGMAGTPAMILTKMRHGNHSQMVNVFWITSKEIGRKHLIIRKTVEKERLTGDIETRKGDCNDWQADTNREGNPLASPRKKEDYWQECQDIVLSCFSGARCREIGIRGHLATILVSKGHATSFIGLRNQLHRATQLVAFFRASHTFFEAYWICKDLSNFNH